MIRHGGRNGFQLAIAVISLTIAVVGLAVLGLLVFAIRFTPLLPSSLLAAVLVTITMTTIATAADIEEAATANALSRAKNNLGVFPPHPHPLAGWTSRSPS